MSEESLNSQSRSQRKTSPLAFLRGFFRDPQQVGSVIPSSRFLEQRIIDAAALEHARLVVELGPGTGGTTRAFLSELGPDARLLTIEMSPHFHGLLNEIDDNRLTNHLGSAEGLGEILRQHHLGQPDVVISGIPFSTIPAEVADRIVEAIRDNLSDDGRFIAYQFRGDVAEFTTPVMGPASCSDLELRNIPPMRVYRWQKGPSR